MINIKNLIKEKKYEEAAEIIKSRLRNESTNGTLHFDLGNINYNQGLFDEALTNFKIANEFIKNNASVNYNIGLCFEKLDSPQDALIFFEKAIKINPKHKNANNSINRISQIITKERLNALGGVRTFESKKSSFYNFLLYASILVLLIFIIVSIFAMDDDFTPLFFLFPFLAIGSLVTLIIALFHLVKYTAKSKIFFSDDFINYEVSTILGTKVNRFYLYEIIDCTFGSNYIENLCGTGKVKFFLERDRKFAVPAWDSPKNLHDACGRIKTAAFNERKKLKDKLI